MEADHVFALNYCNKIKYSQMYSSVLKFTQVYSNVLKCSQVYSAATLLI